MMAKYILLNPGPVNLSERVSRSLSNEQICHRENEFSELLQDIRERLIKIYPRCSADYTAIVLTGSGTCAVEAMVSSLVPTHGRALVLSNGIYGDRIESMFKVRGREVLCLRTNWTDPINIKEVERALDENRDCSYVIAIHNETTTGRLNDMVSLGHLCHHRGVPLLLDTVSSFGAEEIELAQWNCLAVAGTANKCLHGIPGVSFVIVHKKLLEAKQSHADSVYLDLFNYYSEQTKGFSPFTSAVTSLYALREALYELEDDGGFSERQKQYKRLSGIIRERLVQEGLKPLIPLSDFSSMITSFFLPNKWAYKEFHDRLKSLGFVIYSGQGYLKNQIFRVSTMGAISESAILRFCDTVHNMIKERLN
jgi:2-aminoethylphosphonate-pyruvate transaminase